LTIVTEITDAKLLADFRGANREAAFTALVEKYQKRLYWHIRRMVIDHDDANDVLQNTFIKVWNGLENFREQSQLYTWLYRIATNECLTFLEQLKRRQTSSLENVEYSLWNKLTTGKNFSGDQIEMKLQQAILSLPEKQRIVFNLRYYDEMPYEEMSKVLETSVGALKASYHHAAKKIEDFILNR
jgi:RNA polymerase sigma factor (sigma-70 family)